MMTEFFVLVSLFFLFASVPSRDRFVWGGCKPWKGLDLGMKGNELSGNRIVVDFCRFFIKKVII